MKSFLKLQIFNSIWTPKLPCRFFSKHCRGFATQNFSGSEAWSLYKELPEHFNFASDVLDKWTQMEKNGERASSIPALWWVGDKGNEVRWGFEELGFLSRKVANVLSDACGLKKGDRVIVMLPRIPEWWLITVGCMRTGITYIPATTQLTANDIFYRLQASKAKCIITNDTLAPAVDSVVSKCQFLNTRLLVSKSSRDGWLDFKELFKAARGDHDTVKTKSQEPMTIYFTSGTTGFPKMVEHSHSSFGIGMTSTARLWLDLNPSDILWGLSDPGWVKFAYGSFFSPWIQGACIFTQSMLQFEATTILNCLSTFPITSFCGTPTAYRMLVQHDFSSYKFKSLKHCLSGGEPLNPEVMERWKSKTGLDICEGYGQTETVLICSLCKGMKIKPGSMGKAMPPYDVQVIDENANVLPPGKEGDIAIRIKPTRPFCLFSHYVDDPEKTAASERGDFYITGDRGIVDEDGYFWFVGRVDDVILSSGYRIGPFEVENALMEHAAVVEAAAVSSPDPIRGEVVKAFIILSPDFVSHDPEKLTKELQEHVKKVTAPYKYPRKIFFHRLATGTNDQWKRWILHLRMSSDESWVQRRLYIFCRPGQNKNVCCPPSGKIAAPVVHNCVKTKSYESMTIYFTSGTTGSPKMAELSHHSLSLDFAIGGRYWLNLTPSDIMWNMSDTGLIKAALGSVFAPWLQCPCVFLHAMSQFEPTESLNTLARYPITTICSAPTVYCMLVQHDLTRYKFKSLKHCVTGGEPLNPEVMAQWKSQTGLDIYEGYG